jgi:hypothetical protein
MRGVLLVNFLKERGSYVEKPRIRLMNAKDQRFDSWKEISLHLKRTIRTCYRWNKDLGLPVYRVDIVSKRSKVFAYKNEIDEWFKRKSHTGGRKTQAGRRKRSFKKN